MGLICHPSRRALAILTDPRPVVEHSRITYCAAPKTLDFLHFWENVKCLYISRFLLLPLYLTHLYDFRFFTWHSKTAYRARSRTSSPLPFRYYPRNLFPSQIPPFCSNLRESSELHPVRMYLEFTYPVVCPAIDFLPFGGYLRHV